MLVLTRKNEESIVIDQDIEIKILGVYGNKVKIGIAAPRHIPVYRKELLIESEENFNRSEVHHRLNLVR